MGSVLQMGPNKMLFVGNHPALIPKTMGIGTGHEGALVKAEANVRSGQKKVGGLGRKGRTATWRGGNMETRQG